MKKRIAIISEHASPLASLGGVDSGGQNVYVAEMARQLSYKNYEVDVYTRWDNPALPEVITWIPDVRIIHVEAGPIRYIEKEFIYDYMPAFTERMVSFIRSEPIEYELVHANFWMSALVASDIKKILQIPFVVTFHALGCIRKLYQGSMDKFPSERVEIERQIVRDADHIIAECPQDKEDLIQYYQAPAEKVTVIPCGFSPQEFYPIDKLLARMVLKLEPDEFIILQLGRIVPRKGIDNVIRAMGTLRQTSVPSRLLVVGGDSDEPDFTEGRELARLRDIAREHGVEDQVTFTGRKQREVLKYYYAAADVFITTPWYEPFGITPLESMACGTPVIGSNVGGIKYSVEHGKCGFLVPPDDPNALAGRIFELLHDDKQRISMREYGLRRVNAMFTWSRVADKVAALYDRVLMNYPSRSLETHDASAFIKNAFRDAAETFLNAGNFLTGPILQAASAITDCFRKGKKLLICGNGGSAAESQHLAAELIGRFELASRPALPAISLTSDNAVLTAWSNDFGYDQVFERQVEALGQSGDVLVCFSTSGESQNVINAMRKALEKGMLCLALTGKGGGEMTNYAQVNIVVPSNSTQRIQELHLHVIHTLCSLVEDALFTRKTRSTNGTSHHNGFNGKSSRALSIEESISDE